MKFWLGTHEPHWLTRTSVPLFISRRRLTRRGARTFPVARGPWALDSGGFTEIAAHGRWLIGEDEYVELVRRCVEEVGHLAWAAPMDWMCEPPMLAKTGLTVRDHQERTVENFCRLRGRGPFIPVLQGWALKDYLRCIDLYADAGVDLRREPLVGVGSVCRRQAEAEIGLIFRELVRAGVRPHGFGVKLRGLRAYGHLLESADSMAWSYSARRSPPMPGHRHKACQNCFEYALAWRARVVDSLESRAA